MPHLRWANETPVRYLLFAIMRHDGFIDIPSKPQPLQEMLWQRQELGRKLGEVAIRLNDATNEYNEVIAQIIQMNDLIRIEEDMK